MRYGVRGATDKLINQSLALVDNTELEDNLRLKYNFTAKMAAVFRALDVTVTMAMAKTL